MSNISNTPIFTLCRINPDNIYSMYLNGAFSNIRVPRIKGEINIIREVLNPVYSSRSVDGIFSFKTKANTEITIATNNCKNYKAFHENPSKALQGGRCHWCRTDFSHARIGAPLLSEIKHDNNGAPHLIFYTYGVFCTFNCCLAYLQRERKLGHYNDCMYYATESNLKTLYRINHPDGKELLPANDWTLLATNDGSQSYETWSNGSYQYREIPGIIISPVKQGFIREPVNH